MGKPRAALVATAVWMAMLHQAMKGTLMKPPPAPTRPDRKPMTPPASSWPPVPGIWRVGGGFLSRNIWVDRKSVGSGRSVSVRVVLGGRRVIKNKKIKKNDV